MSSRRSSACVVGNLTVDSLCGSAWITGNVRLTSSEEARRTGDPVSPPALRREGGRRNAKRSFRIAKQQEGWRLCPRLGDVLDVISVVRTGV